jgi:hypothetical protein
MCDCAEVWINCLTTSADVRDCFLELETFNIDMILQSPLQYAIPFQRSIKLAIMVEQFQPAYPVRQVLDWELNV